MKKRLQLILVGSLLLPCSTGVLLASNAHCRSWVAQAVTQIVKQVFERGQGLTIALGLAGLFRAAQMDERLTAGLTRIEAGTDAGVGVERDVTFDLCVQLSVGAGTGKQAEQANGKGSKFSHHDLSLLVVRYSVRSACMGSTEAARRAGM